GISHSDSLTNNATINVSGLEVGATWQYQVDGTAGAGWGTGTGSSFTASEGVHNYTVRQTNVANNNDETTAVTYTLDTIAIAPSLRLVSDTGINHSDNITANATINVLGLESRASWSYQVECVSGDWITGIGSSFTAQSGSHSYFVRQIDAAGNTSAASAVVTFTLDATAIVATDTTLGNIAAGTGGFVLIGEADGDFSGRTVSAAGDINGDGYADFMIGAYGANNVAGKSYVVFGRSNWSGVSSLNLSTIASGTGGFVLIGEASDDHSGWSLATTGDINGDGYADFMVGAYGVDVNGKLNAGKTYVVFGRPNWSGVSALNLNTIAAGQGGFALIGQADDSDNDQSGFSVSATGDINGDGYADFMIGESGKDRNRGGAGATYIVFGRSNWNDVTTLNLSTIEAGMGGFMLIGEDRFDFNGNTIGNIGDIDGDGYADFMVGSIGANSLAGKSYVVFGRSNWSGVSSLSLSTIAAGTGGFVLVGEG
ncbi:MAG: Ig-like domain-containing protein, partial [Methylophilaceae bacterium]|nr:Ig-like domain-containing protein [Methylophilaceae bacterium]